MAKPKPLPDLTYLRECFDLDAEAGQLWWRERPAWHFPTKRGQNISNARFAGTLAGTPHGNGYVVINMAGMRNFRHRIIWKMHYGTEPPVEVDHRDTNRANDKIGNLRDGDRTKNNRNSKLGRNNTTGYKGVIVYKNRFIAQISVNHRSHYLGIFDTAETAHAAYCRAAQEHFGEYWNGG